MIQEAGRGEDCEEELFLQAFMHRFDPALFDHRLHSS